MSQQWTILLPADEPPRIAALVRTLTANHGRTTVKGKVSDWYAIIVRGASATLTLNRRTFGRAGDEFSKMKLGMWAYFDGVETKHTAVKRDVLGRIEGFAMAIGVVAEPGFVETLGHFDCLFGLTREFDGIIWNGSGMLNHEGKVLLDVDGNCEVAVRIPSTRPQQRT